MCNRFLRFNRLAFSIACSLAIGVTQTPAICAHEVDRLVEVSSSLSTKRADPKSGQLQGLDSSTKSLEFDACTIAPPPKSKLPHIKANGPKAAAIVEALDKLLATQDPPILPQKKYEIPSMICQNLYEHGGANVGGYACSFQIQVEGAGTRNIDVYPPSKLAQSLYETFVASGVKACDDLVHQERMRLQNVFLRSSSVQYDDSSIYIPQHTPNVVARGTDATNVVKAFAEAGIKDCDPTRKIYLVCNAFTGSPSCFFEWLDVERVGDSDLIMACGPQSGLPEPGAVLSSAASATAWNSILNAAKNAGYQPLSGTLEQVNVINVSWLRWDGSELGFTLLADQTSVPDDPAQLKPDFLRESLQKRDRRTPLKTANID